MVESQNKMFESKKLLLSKFGKDVGGWATQNQYPRVLGDVNGDGKADIVGFASDKVVVAFSTGDGFEDLKVAIDSVEYTSATNWVQNLHPRFLADINGDGKADIVGFAVGRVVASFSTGDGFSNIVTTLVSDYSGNTGWSSFDKYPRTLADVNGDGKADIVGFGNVAVFVSFSTGHEVEPPKQVISKDYTVTDNWTGFNTNPRLLADINGDGKADIVGFGRDGLCFSFSTGDGFGSIHPNVAADFTRNAGWDSFDKYPRALGDVNGDGKADIVGFASDGVYVAFSTGSSFKSPQLVMKDFGTGTGWESQDLHPRFLADVNGDGKVDIVGFAASGVWVAYNQYQLPTKTAGLNIAKAGQANEIIIEKDIYIDPNSAVATELEQCKNIILNFNPLEGDTINLSHYGQFRADQVSFATFTSVRTSTNEMPVSGVKISGEEDYVACVYGFDADKFFAPDYVDPYTGAPHMLNPHDVITLSQAQHFHGEL